MNLCFRLEIGLGVGTGGSRSTPRHVSSESLAGARVNAVKDGVVGHRYRCLGQSESVVSAAGLVDSSPDP
jgi:hypothetical protein